MTDPQNSAQYNEQDMISDPALEAAHKKVHSRKQNQKTNPT